MKQIKEKKTFNFTAAAVLASQQAAAVAVINPFPPAPPTK